jgi:hypothetical protein
MAVDSAQADGGGGAVLSWARWSTNVGDGIYTALPAGGAYIHVVVTYDGATMSLYVNGVLASSGASTRSISTLPDPFRVATYSDFLSSADCFPGTIDEVAMYDHALSAARVARHYHVGSGL